MPHEALNIALSNRDLSNFHPIIAHVRSIVGYEKLIQNTKFVANIFEKEYQEALIKLFNGQLDLSVQVDDSTACSASEARMSSDAVADELLELLNGVKDNNRQD